MKNSSLPPHADTSKSHFSARFFRLLILLICATLLPAPLLAWDNNVVHPSITTNALTWLTNRVKIYDVQRWGYMPSSLTPQCSFINEGAVKEDYSRAIDPPGWNTSAWGSDTDSLAAWLSPNAIGNWISHAYNPNTGGGWWQITSIDAVDYAQGIWDAAVSDYRAGRKADAFFKLGRLCHLLEDMSSPAHTQGDMHGFDFQTLKKGDDAETWGEANYPLNLYSIARSMRPSIDGLAGMTADSNAGFMMNLAWRTYYASTWQGKLVAATGDTQPDSELKRMVSAITYEFSALDPGGKWFIPEIGNNFNNDPLDSEWWRCEGNNEDGTGYFYLENIESFVPKMRRLDAFRRTLPTDTYTSVLLTNTDPLAKIYANHLWPLATAWVAGMVKYFLEEADDVIPQVTFYAVGTKPYTDIKFGFTEDMDDATFNNTTINVSGSASGTHTCTFNFDHSTQVLTINPDAGFVGGEVVTVRMSIGVKCQGNEPLTFVPFTFAIDPSPTFSISVSAGSHGSISPSGTVSVTQGGSRTFTAAPESTSYVVDKWYLDGALAQTGGGQYTLSNVQAGHSVYVTFNAVTSTEIAVTSPVLGRYQELSTIWISWTYLYGGSEFVTIDLLRNGAVVRQIAASVLANTRGYSWKIPGSSDVALGTGYQVRVTSQATAITGVSGSFEIIERPDLSEVIEIRSISDLQGMADRGYYKLMTDINAKNFNFIPITKLIGTLDGNGHTISELTINLPAEDNVALIRYTSGTAVIKNLTLAGGRITGRSYVGAFCGTFNALLQNCHTSAEVFGNTNYPGSTIGGLVGDNYGGIIRNCSSFVPYNDEIRGYNDEVGGIAGNNSPSGIIEFCWSTTDKVRGSDNAGQRVYGVGGIAGKNYGTIRECYSTNRVVVTEDYNAGGIAGENNGTIVDCYSLSRTDGGELIGGLVGWSAAGMVSNSYAAGLVNDSAGGGLVGELRGGTFAYCLWDALTTGKAQPCYDCIWPFTNCFGKTTAEMKQKATFTALGWDFTDVWDIQEGVAYPSLRGAKPCPPPPGTMAASTSRNDGVLVSWSGVAGAGCYMVFRAGALDSTPQPVSGWVTETSFLDTNALRNVNQYYWVKAALTTHGAGPSEFSSAASGWAFPGPLVAPSSVTASDGQPYQVVVTWNPVPEATHYQVFRSETPGAVKTLVSGGWQANTSWTDSPPLADGSYYYWIKAATSSSGDRASDYSASDTGYFIIPDVENPTTTISCSPALPIETQAVTLNVMASDNRALGKLVAYWNDGVLRSNVWDIAGTNQTSRVAGIGSFAAGQQVTLWAVAEDSSRNRTETVHQTVVVQAETVSTPWPPSGNSTVLPNQLLQLTATGSSTSLGASVQYQFDWQDGSLPAWASTNQSHAWPNEGTYLVRVRARSQLRPNRESAWSSALTVHVAIPPTITSEPQSIIVNQGATAIFNVATSGSVPMSYQWRKDGTNLTDGARITGATSGLLKIAGVQLSDEGSYSVVVSNPGGIDPSQPAKLTVLVPPVISAPPASATNVVTSAATFSVVATGSTPLRFVWRKGGASLSDGGRIIGASSAVLSITNLQMTDAGSYDVVITNVAGSVTSAPPAVLTVRDTLAPTLTISSHVELQMLPSTAVTLLGFATDTDRGDGGVASVTVNGTRATDDTATGTGVANWSRSLTLSAGTNTITVIATDTRGNSVTNRLRLIADTTKPTLAISSPTVNQRWSNAVFSVKGTATDNLRLRCVWFQQNSNAWTLGTTTNNWTNWTAQLVLSPGTNSLRAYAVDDAGNGSTTNTVKMVYVLSGLLQVAITGQGSLTPNYANTMLEVGKGYSMTAKGTNGHTFVNWQVSTNWIGSLTLTNAALGFMMQSDLTLRANFVDTMKPTVALTNVTRTYTNSGTVTIAANSADNVAVTRVDFYDGATLMSSTSASPYWHGWVFSETNNGAHVWTARSYDAAGNVSTSSPITLTVSIDVVSPTVSITSPTNGRTYTTRSITVSGTATDLGSPASGVGMVQVRLNGGNWTNATGTTSWTRSLALLPCDNVIEARSRDKAGNYSTTMLVAVKYTAPNSAPNTPVNVWPATGTIGVPLTPTLRSSAFVDANCADTHEASQWQVLSGTGATIIWDSGTNPTAKTNITVPAGKLAYASNYLWKVRYRDNSNSWSSYSLQTAFTTAGPALSIWKSNTNVIVAWTNSPSGFHLESSGDVSEVRWGLVAQTPTVVSNMYRVTLPISGNQTLFRLTTQPHPVLIAQISGGNIVLTWPTNASGFTLQWSTNPLSTNWTPVTPAPVVVNGKNTVTNAATESRSRFYRLKK